MATEHTTAPQSLAEIRSWPVSFEDDLLTGVTVTGVTVRHEPPEGPVSPTSILFVASPNATITLGPLSVIGLHKLHIFGALSDGEISEILLKIPVNY